jgi:hypothetical protein
MSIDAPNSVRDAAAEQERRDRRGDPARERHHLADETAHDADEHREHDHDCDGEVGDVHRALGVALRVA